MKGGMKDSAKDMVTPNETLNDMRILQVETEVLRERIKDKDLLIEDIREDRDEWKKQAQTLLLQNPIKQAEKAEELQKDILATTLPDNTKTIGVEKDLRLYTLYFVLFSTLVILIGILWFANYHSNQIQSENFTASDSRRILPSQTYIPDSNFSFQQHLPTN